MKKKVFISGGSLGIGLALAQKFYAEKYHVIICARGEDALKAAKKQMPDLQIYSCDMSDKRAVKDLAQKLNETYGYIDILINNAGVFLLGNLYEEADEAYENMMRTNVDSAYYLCKGLLPAMIEKKSGTIVNVCSIASLKAYPGGGSYSLSKYAMLGLSKTLREELKPFGISVISVMPGAVKTRSWDGADVPTERLMPTSDIAEIIWTACNMSRRTVVEDIVLRPMLGDL